MACQDGIEIIQNFCCMHLGVNIRKAFLEGMKSVCHEEDSSTSQRDSYPVDSLVHEFCKLLGKHGAPEYCLGGLSFPDFLEEMCASNSDRKEYYVQCLKVRLDRQVGSRYFVTASNTG